MKKFASFITFCVCLLAAGSAFGYDAEKAKGLDQFYRPFEGKVTAKQLQMIKSADFVKAIKSGEKLFVLDVRTKGESRIIGIALPETLAVEMNQVFIPETLDKIPTDRKVVIICKAGYRAGAVAMGLRQIGFKNVYILKKGLADLAQYMTAKNVY